MRRVMQIALMAVVFAPGLARGQAAGNTGKNSPVQGFGLPSGGPTRPVPGDDYFAAFGAYYSGDYKAAFRAFQDAGKGGIRSTDGRWVDAICYNAMMGECLYHMGDLADALDRHTTALKLFVQHQDWLLRVQFPATLDALQTIPKNPVTWGVSSRRVMLGRYPETISTFQGNPNNQQAIANGGVVAAPQLYPLRVTEIMRCIAVSLKRRTELMGPACPHDPFTGVLLDVCSRKLAPPNHWSQAWMDVQLGLAYQAAGKPAQAASELQKSLLAVGQFEHPLTSTALLELGKISFAAGQFDAAAGYLIEATYSGAVYGQYDVLEEAFRGGLITHLVSGRKDLYPPLLAAAAWARQNSQPLKASCLILAAENLSHVGDSARARVVLTEAQRDIGRHDMLAGEIGARFNYETAKVNFQTGNLAPGSVAFAASMAYQKNGGSRRLLHISLVDALYVSGSHNLSERVFDGLFAEVLREPTPADWAVDPMDTLTVTMTFLALPMEHWFDIAMRRNAPEQALEIVDRIRRQRFFATLPVGGRMLALRWVLEAPRESLTDRALLQRQDLLAKYPKYAELARQVADVRADLRRAPLVPEADDAGQIQQERFGKLAKLCTLQELMLHDIALRRDASDFLFPPLLDLKELQKKLPPHQLVLAFFNGSRAVYGFAIGHDKYATWQVEAPNKLRTEIADLLKRMGNLDKIKPVESKELRADAWRALTKKILPQLTNKAKSDTWDQFQELVIVPDGILWYCPFEALQIGDDESSVPLLSKVRVRYAPTVALTVPDGRPPRPDLRTGVVAGKLLPKDDVQLSKNETDELKQALEGVSRLPGKLPAPSSYMAKICDRLIVYHDMDDTDRVPYDWSPVQIDRGKPGSSLGAWFPLPFGGPEQVVLPGFHTPAESALKKTGSGDEIFLTLCGLMSTGTRTVLLSRWRVGGQSTYDLMREFVQELPHSTAAAAWQRSVQLRMQAAIDPDREPRVRIPAGEEPLKAGHPFFWSGYLLADTGASPAKVEAPIVKDAEPKKVP